MKITTIATVVAIIASAPSYAQSVNSTSTAQSQSGSSVHNGGDTIHSSTAIAPSVGSTAPCVIGRSGGIGLGGVGLSAGGGRIDRDCVTRTEAQILTKIATMRGPSRTAAILHFCTNTESMRRTMMALGWCSYAK